MRLSQLIWYCQEKHKVHNITVIRIAEFINTVVGTRKTNNNKRAVVMKLDVEVRIGVEVDGLELELIWKKE